MEGYNQEQTCYEVPADYNELFILQLRDSSAF